MFQHLKVAIRQFRKNTGFSALNILGLALGMACATLIVLWIGSEYSYNRFHKQYDNLYQLMESQTYDGKIYTFASMPGPFAAAAKQEFPEIELAARTEWGYRVLFSRDDKMINEVGHFTDPDFFKLFSFKVLKGDTTGLLQDPAAIAITDKMAERFFGKEDPLGKQLRANNDKLYQVKAVIEEPSRESSIRFSWLASFHIYEEQNTWLQNWGNNGIQTFVKLKEGANAEALNKKLNGYIVSKDSNAAAHPFLLPMKDWRLRSNFVDGKQSGGRIQYVRLFSIVALLIILIACINFMNLATARSEQRAREVGVRKTMGAGRGGLIRQFFTETIAMAFFSMLLAALLVALTLPAFNKLVEKELSFDLSNPIISLGLPLMALACGLLAGIYPALYLSSFNPVTVFKGLKIGKNSATVYVRKGLVVTQFAVSIVLIISTIIIYQQIQHAKNRELGYNKENVIYSGLNGDMNKRFPAIYNDLMATNVVENAALSTSPVMNIGSSSGNFSWQGKQPGSELLVSVLQVTPQFLPAMGMQLKSGRNFNETITPDSNRIIINETLAGIIGKEDPVGKIITQGTASYTVVGVVKDYIYNNIYTKPEPLILFCDTSNVFTMMIRLKATSDLKASLAKVEKVVKTHSPAYPFEYTFLDAAFNDRFKSEMLIGNLSRLFAVLTIIISCLGLFGLAAYTAERRTKEIGIRKVLGASVPGVVAMLSKDFIRLVALAAIIAFPLAWWFMNSFLSEYAYRVQIHWWVFAIAGALSFTIALLTVSFQAIRAALTNPVDSLRSE
ncbi:MAG: ABC transporter permease [Chitinophagaceae bacterium]